MVKALPKTLKTKMKKKCQIATAKAKLLALFSLCLLIFEVFVREHPLMMSEFRGRDGVCEIWTLLIKVSK